MTSNFEFHPDCLSGAEYDQIDDQNSNLIKVASGSSWLLPLKSNSGNFDEDLVQQLPFSSSDYNNYNYTNTSLANWPLQEHLLISKVQNHPQSESEQAYLNASTGYYQQLQYTYTGSLLCQAPFESEIPAEAQHGSAGIVAEPQEQWTSCDPFQSPIEYVGKERLQSVDNSSLVSSSTRDMFFGEKLFPSASFNDVFASSDWHANSNTLQHYPIFDPSQTSIISTDPDASNASVFQQNLPSFADNSPGDASNYYPEDLNYKLNTALNCYYSQDVMCHSHPFHNTHMEDKTSNIEPVTSPILSPSDSTSFDSKTLAVGCKLAPKKSSKINIAKTAIHSELSIKKSAEKRVGKRRGPLLPEQRKQASEIRKLRACLRCKFLKKTCDTGDPCASCQPSHARLWQVPCTRVDIKDLVYFMKDWNADYESYKSRGNSNHQIWYVTQKERLIWITHGYGFSIPVLAQEICRSDDSYFVVKWVENVNGQPVEFSTETEKVAAGPRGISDECLSSYLDNLLDNLFESFIDEHFEGTPFLTEILKTAFRYYTKEKQPVIRKALKLVLAYNLTLQVVFIEKRGEESHIQGLINYENSKYNGKIIAPVIIRYQIKCALARTWRDLQSEVLTELSALYSGVYSGSRIRNWPTIFILASILLAIWEEIQFDSHYRIPDPNAVQNFCNEMEAIAVPVIVGLFHAISQKLPSFIEWDTKRHGHILNNNSAICEAMTEMKSHIIRYSS